VSTRRTVWPEPWLHGPREQHRRPSRGPGPRDDLASGGREVSRKRVSPCSPCKPGSAPCVRFRSATVNRAAFEPRTEAANQRHLGGGLGFPTSIVSSAVVPTGKLSLDPVRRFQKVKLCGGGISEADVADRFADQVARGRWPAGGGNGTSVPGPDFGGLEPSTRTVHF